MRRSKSRMRGFHPEKTEPGYLEPQVLVTISLPVNIWHWLHSVVGGRGFSYCVEEIIVGALRCMAGRNVGGGGVDKLVGEVAAMRGVSAAQAMYVGVQDQNEEAVAILLEASRLAAHGVWDAVLSDRLPEGQRGETLVKIWSLAAGRDMQAEIDSVRAEVGGKPVESLFKWHRTNGDLDDGIPF